MHIYKDILVHKIMDTQNKGWPYFPLGLLFCLACSIVHHKLEMT